MNIVRQLDEHQWREFVDSHQSSNIFHTPEMFQVFEQTAGHRPTLWAVVDDARVLALLLPVQVTLMTRLRCLTTRAIAYGSVLCASGPEGQRALALLLQTYIQQVNGTPLFTELRNLFDLQAAQPTLRAHDFVYEDHLNYLIDLRPGPEAVLKNIGRHTRKHIRRGLRQGEVVVQEVQEREQISAFYKILSQTYQVARVPLGDLSLFQAAFDLLYPKNMVRFTLAYVDQTPVAASVELLYKDIMYGWYGGVDRAYGSYRPNELLTWDILRWGAENGYNVYDFGGAGKPDEEYGVRDFKAKFGGSLVNYGRNTYTHSQTRLRLSKLGYAIYRALSR